MKLVITDKAKADLVRIGDNIAKDNPRRALSFVVELEARCRALPMMPFLYPLLRRREPSGVRRAVHGKYLIFYKVQDDVVYVIHIMNGAMDYETILFPED
jgi:toxin ParE1/3/4